MRSSMPRYRNRRSAPGFEILASGAVISILSTFEILPGRPTSSVVSVPKNDLAGTLNPLYSARSSMYSPSTNLISSNALFSFGIAASSTSGLQKAVEFMSIRPAKMFPAASKLESADCPADRGKMRLS